MKLSVLFTTAMAGFVSAHHVITNIHINGEDKGMGTCMRLPPNTNPLTDINSPNIACNVNGDKGVARVCEANAGDSISFIWRSWPDASNPGSIDPSHQGPCAVYLKKAPEGTSVTKMKASGDGWFKIFHDGVKDGKFCSQRIIENGGKMKVRLPTDLAPGEYLIRGEQIALHQAKSRFGAQYYVGCAQIVVSSAGQRTAPRNKVSIPGYIKPTDPGVLFDYWRNEHPKTYATPGPPVFSPPANSARIMKHIPEPGNFNNCVATNANWCAKPLQSYNGEGDCWAKSGKCWSQLTECYNSAPITGSAGCRKYEQYCYKVQAVCRACRNNCKGSFPSSSS